MALARISFLFTLALAAAQVGAAEPKIASIGGAITEIVYALAAEDQLVAVDTTSKFPPAATRLPTVGYQRALSAEGLLSMQPDLIIATAEAGPPNVLQQVRAAGVTVVQTAVTYTADNVLDKVRLIASLLNRSAKGQQLEQSFTRDWRATRQRVEGYRQRAQYTPKVLFIFDQSGANSMVAGSGTAADAMIVYSGGRNVMHAIKGYKPLTAEAVIAAAPDVLLITNEGLAAIGGIEKLLQRPGLALTPAGKHKKVIAMDSLYLLGFGLRLPQAVTELAQQLHQ